MKTLFTIWSIYDYQKFLGDVRQVYFGIKSPVQVLIENEINSRMKYILKNIYM